MKVRITKWFVLICFLAGTSHSGFAQLNLIQRIDAPGNLHTTDYLGNIYVVSGAVLTRYDINGRITGTYRSVLPGNIDLIDASNPFQVILFYRDYNRIAIVDRNLIQTSQDIFLSGLGIRNAESVCFSTRGGIWILDWSLRNIIHFDQDFRQINQISITGALIRNEDSPLHLAEREGDLYISFASGGLWKFDRMGGYKNITPLDQIRYFQVNSNGVIFVKGGEILVLHPVSGNHQSIDPQIQEPILSARLEGNILFVFTSGQIYIYKSG